MRYYLSAQVIGILIIFAIAFLCICIINKPTPYEYLVNHSKSYSESPFAVSEYLAEDEKDNCIILFYFNTNKEIVCVIMKERPFSYQIIRRSGTLPIVERTDLLYLYSGYGVNGNRYWVEWAPIMNEQITEIYLNGQRMQMLEISDQSFRIAWLTGVGECNEREHEVCAGADAW